MFFRIVNLAADLTALTPRTADGKPEFSGMWICLENEKSWPPMQAGSQ